MELYKCEYQFCIKDAYDECLFQNYCNNKQIQKENLDRCLGTFVNLIPKMDKNKIGTFNKNGKSSDTEIKNDSYDNFMKRKCLGQEGY
jgi:hypothetical protein